MRETIIKIANRTTAFDVSVPKDSVIHSVETNELFITKVLITQGETLEDHKDDLISFSVPKNEMSEVVDNCKVIQVCKTLDLSRKGNQSIIEIPDGYVGLPTNGMDTACLQAVCLNEDILEDSATVTAKMQVTYYQYGDDTPRKTTEVNIVKFYTNPITLCPYVGNKIILETTSANTGTSHYPYVTVYGTIFCHKKA